MKKVKIPGWLIVVVLLAAAYWWYKKKHDSSLPFVTRRGGRGNIANSYSGR